MTDSYTKYYFGATFYNDVFEEKDNEHKRKYREKAKHYNSVFGWWDFYYTCLESKIFNDHSDGYTCLKWYTMKILKI